MELWAEQQRSLVIFIVTNYRGPQNSESKITEVDDLERYRWGWVEYVRYKMVSLIHFGVLGFEVLGPYGLIAYLKVLSQDPIDVVY